VSDEVTKDELPMVKQWVADLHNVMEEVREKYHFGRSIAAPQLGYKKRVVYLNIDKPTVIINPEYIYKSEEMFEVWDDCMCFPNLLVLVKRHLKVNLKYRDENW
jgi:peptide deformylase